MCPHLYFIDEDYKAALALVARYFDNVPKVNSDAGTHFEAMVKLLEACEARLSGQFR